MTLPVSLGSSQVQYVQPIQQNEGTTTPSGSVKEYKLGSATIHDKIGGDVVTIKHWIGEDGNDNFQPFVHGCPLRNAFGPSVRQMYKLKEELDYEHSQDITFEMGGPDYIKITEIDGDQTGIEYVDLQNKKKLETSEGYGYNAYPHKPIPITEDEAKSKILKIPVLSSTDIDDSVGGFIPLYNSHGIAVFIMHKDFSSTIYCAAPGDTALAPAKQVLVSLTINMFSLSGMWPLKAVWKDSYGVIMSCEGQIYGKGMQLNGDSATFQKMDFTPSS